jgi:hypothetical protein
VNSKSVLKKLRTIFFVLISFFSILFFSWLATWETYLGYLGLMILFFGIIFWRLKGIKFLYCQCLLILQFSEVTRLDLGDERKLGIN